MLFKLANGDMENADDDNRWLWLVVTYIQIKVDLCFCELAAAQQLDILNGP